MGSGCSSSSSLSPVASVPGAPREGYVVVGAESKYKAGKSLKLKKGEMLGVGLAGFDFHPRPVVCLEHYNNPFAPGNRFFKVVALGDVVGYGDRFATDLLYIQREINETRFRAMCTVNSTNIHGDYKSYVMGRLHSIGNAAAYRSADGSEKLWYKHGLLHRIDKPAKLIRDVIKKEAGWYENGEQHRVYGPSSIVINRRSVHFLFMRHDQFHNSYGPAVIAWYYDEANKRVVSVRNGYYLNGKIARPDDIWEKRADDFDADEWLRRIQEHVRLGGDFWEFAQAMFTALVA